MATNLASKAWLAVLALLLARPVLALETDRLHQALHHQVDGFEMPGDDTLLNLEQQFRQLLRPDGDRDLAASRRGLEQLGFRWQRLDEQLIMLTDGQGRGLGHYLFRLDARSSLMLQAPHQFYDLHTGTLALELFLAGQAEVLALNSAHRRTGIAGRNGHADLAHLEGSAFDALTRAFGLSRSAGVVLQLHGFAAGKRQSAAGREADLIVSSGQRWLQPIADRFASCFADAGDWRVRRYPVDVGELGGTTNVQGALLRRLGNNRFVHLELSRPLRETLQAGGSEFDAFGACVQALTSGRP